MIGLNSTLSLASQALSANTGALAITNNNIANVNTPGYSRQIVNLSADALVTNGASQDNGVSFDNYTSVRDEVLNISINQKTSSSSSLQTQSASWTQIESAFSNTNSGLGASLSNFFSAVSGLSTSPNDAATRQSVFSAAGQLVDAFHQTAATLASAQNAANTGVAGTVADINNLTKQIADLNGQLAAMRGTGEDGGSTQDQRDALTTQLAQLIGFTPTSTDSTPSLSTANGSPLVIGNMAYALQVAQGTDGKAHVMDSQGKDITSTITGGSLGGALAMRDESVPQLTGTLDQLTTQFASAMNTAQAKGYAQDGSTGQPMFSVPSDGSSITGGLSLALTDASGLAASSDGSAGSSGNLSNLLAVQTQALPAGQNPTEAYASFVQTIGTSSAAVNSAASATSASLTQLTTQQASQSGVSIDEETTNLLRYQQAYTAAAKVISTINNLYSTLMNMSTVTS